MKKISLNRYAPILSDLRDAYSISSIISEALSAGEEIEIDFNGIVAMATCCSREIFGKIYKDLGAEAFFKMIIIKNASQDVQGIIRAGIRG